MLLLRTLTRVSKDNKDNLDSKIKEDLQSKANKDSPSKDSPSKDSPSKDSPSKDSQPLINSCLLSSSTQEWLPSNKEIHNKDLQLVQLLVLALLEPLAKQAASAHQLQPLHTTKDMLPSRATTLPLAQQVSLPTRDLSPLPLSEPIN
jgi:hypothetical protein